MPNEKGEGGTQAQVRHAGEEEEGKDQEAELEKEIECGSYRE